MYNTHMYNTYNTHICIATPVGKILKCHILDGLWYNSYRGRLSSSLWHLINTPSLGGVLFLRENLFKFKHFQNSSQKSAADSVRPNTPFQNQADGPGKALHFSRYNINPYFSYPLFRIYFTYYGDM